MGEATVESSSEFWLPEDFLSDDFFVEKTDSVGWSQSSPECYAEDEYLAGLTQKMALSFLLQDSRNCGSPNSVMGNSPPSTLCEIGGWPHSGSGSPFPPPVAEFDPLALLNAAAERVARMRLYEQQLQRSIIQQQRLQAARFYHLRRQQLLKQHWARHHQAAAARVRDKMCSLGLAHPALTPLQKQQQQHPDYPQATHRNAGAQNVIFNRRESKGTGVFLPRRTGTQNEPRTNLECSRLLLPARTDPSFNQNHNDATVNSNSFIGERRLMGTPPLCQQPAHYLWPSDGCTY